jgi:outer membrane receptor protein involved in Fe transport
VTPTLITRQRQNLGRLRSCGLETDAEAVITSRVRLSGGYLFVDPRVISFPPNTLLEGLLIPQVARHQYSFQASFSDPQILSAALQLRGTSSQFDDDQNRLTLNKFVTVDAYISRRLTRNFSVFAAAENLFDSLIESGRTPLLTIASRRSVRAGIRIEFSKK